MNTYNICLLDDDAVFLPAFRDKLLHHLRKLPCSFSVQAFSRCADFEKSIAVTPPDLIISDIELVDEDQNGISFLRGLQQQGCTAELIFLTGHLHYATDVFELRPLYFILKKEFEQRISTAIEFFLQKMQKRQATLTLNVGNVTEIIPTDTILYCERVRRKTVVRCIDRDISVSTSLTELSQCLPADAFSFAHQSVLVNLHHIVRFGKTSVTVSNNMELPVARSHANEFRAALAAYLEN